MRPRRLTSKDKSPESSRKLQDKRVSSSGYKSSTGCWQRRLHRSSAVNGYGARGHRLCWDELFCHAAAPRSNLSFVLVWAAPVSTLISHIRLGQKHPLPSWLPQIGLTSICSHLPGKVIQQTHNPREPPGLFHHVRKQMTAMCESGSRYSRDTYAWASESPEP